MRRIFRWKRLQIHNIEKMKINIQGLSHEAIVYQQKEYANDPGKIQTHIAVFSSVFGSKRTMDAFCQSLCVYFNRVVLINSKKIMKELSLTSASSPFSPTSQTSSIQYLSDFLNNQNIRNIIAFDGSAAIVNSILQHINNQDNKFNIVYIRPVNGMENVKSVMSSLNPFNGFPYLIDRVRLALSGNIKYLRNIQIPVKESLDEIIQKHNVCVIQPKNPMDMTINPVNWSQKLNEMPNFQAIHIRKGGWSFHQQETVVLGNIFSFFNF